ncbi:MAG: GxxExxY protein [Bacteroidetes bacterium]|nr:GxxExxY protein [Bacteroidota bacterium]
MNWDEIKIVEEGIKEYKSLNDITYGIIGCAFKVHKALGPGLLESSYEACLFYELTKSGFIVERQRVLPLIYDEIKLDAGYRLDLLVNDSVIIEIKSVEELAPIHKAQILTYLKLSKIKLGLLINFNTVDLKEGIQRLIM